MAKEIFTIPTSKKEMDALGWQPPDVILFSGDVDGDHPSKT